MRRISIEPAVGGLSRRSSSGQLAVHRLLTVHCKLNQLDVGLGKSAVRQIVASGQHETVRGLESMLGKSQSIALSVIRENVYGAERGDWSSQFLMGTNAGSSRLIESPSISTSMWFNGD
jgi:hypothetical protein